MIGEIPCEVLLPVRVAKLESFTNICYVLGYITYEVEKFWLPLNDNIDLQKYTQISDANLRPFCCRRFCGFKDDVQRHTVDNFSQEWKTKNNISSMTWPARFRLVCNRECVPCNYTEATY